MAVKKTKIRAGVFEHERIDINLTQPTTEDIKELVKSIEASTPEGRVAKWKPHAERLGVAIEIIRAAENELPKTVDRPGGKQFKEVFWREDVFERLMAEAQLLIERAQVEQTLIPAAKHGSNFRGQKRGEGALKKILRQSLDELGQDVSFKAVLKYLEGHPEGVDDVDDENIYLIDKSSPVTIARAQNALSEIKSKK